MNDESKQWRHKRGAFAANVTMDIAAAEYSADERCCPSIPRRCMREDCSVQCDVDAMSNKYMA